MGDIVRGEKIRGEIDLNKIFNVAIRSSNKAYRTALASPLTITLGDEFQGLAMTTASGFEVILHVRYLLLEKAVNCRFTLGVVTLDTKLNRENAWNMMGSGLADARKKLNDKRDSNLYRFVIPGHLVEQRLLEAVGLSLTTIEKEWTETQLRYFLLNREANSINKIAREFNVSNRAVYKVLEAAKWSYYRSQLEAIQFALSKLDEGLELK